MKRQYYFPKIVSARPEWFATFAAQLALANAILGLPAPAVTAIIADVRFCEYACGVWLAAVREFGPSATAAIDELFSGGSGSSFALPVFSVPALPAGVVLVAAGRGTDWQSVRRAVCNLTCAFIERLGQSPAAQIANLCCVTVTTIDTPVADPLHQKLNELPLTMRRPRTKFQITNCDHPPVVICSLYFEICLAARDAALGEEICDC